MADQPGPRTPLWVKLFGVVLFVLFFLFVIMMFTGRDRHGSARHKLSGDIATEQINRL